MCSIYLLCTVFLSRMIADYSNHWCAYVCINFHYMYWVRRTRSMRVDAAVSFYIVWLFECMLSFFLLLFLFYSFHFHSLYRAIVLAYFTVIYLFVYLFIYFFWRSGSLSHSSTSLSIHFRANGQTSLNAQRIINVQKMNGNHFSLLLFCSFRTSFDSSWFFHGG